MNKRIFKSVCVALATICSSSYMLCSCFGGEGDSSAPLEYTIQYTDETGIHSLSVEAGAVYSLVSIPEKYGYDFLGLFDAKTGGTQYIDETGSSLAAFTDNKNLVLFPQFKAKEYRLIFDYQGAEVTDSRSMVVTYDSQLSKLPNNLTMEHKEFTGWYTEPNKQGKQISDKYGVLPLHNKVTEAVFDLSSEDNTIYLYAGFESVKYTVTFHFDDTHTSEEKKVEHGTEIKNVVPETRVNGNAVLTWSKMKDDTNKEQVFTGKVTEDMVLYAAEYAPVIDFDENGGEEVIPVVARAGANVSLPTPTRTNYKFVEWQDDKGNTYNAATMPAESITLKAVWQAKLVFDENGGTQVDDISKAAGESITLPMPEKEGYIFAGWYTAGKELYESKTMPSESVTLKAGWYQTKMKVVGSSTKEGNSAYLDVNEESKQSAEWRTEFDLSDVLSSSGANIHVKLTYTVRLQTGKGGKINFADYFYDQNIIGNSYILASESAEVSTKTSREITFEANLAMKSDTLYVAHYAKNIGTYSDRVYFKRVSLEITYPDTTNLYL